MHLRARETKRPVAFDAIPFFIPTLIRPSHAMGNFGRPQEVFRVNLAATNNPDHANFLVKRGYMAACSSSTTLSLCALSPRPAPRSPPRPVADPTKLASGACSPFRYFTMSAKVGRCSGSYRQHDLASSARSRGALGGMGGPVHSMQTFMRISLPDKPAHGTLISPRGEHVSGRSREHRIHFWSLGDC